MLGVIWELPKASEYVFPGKVPGQPIKDFKKAWKTAVGKAKVMRKGRAVHVTVQSLRKACATAISRKASEAVLQNMLGHAPGTSITKKYYIHVTEEDRRKASVELPIIEGAV